MAEQIMSEAITKAMAEATRIAIQTMAEMQAQSTPNVAGCKLGGPTLKQPTFDWEAPDKCTELKAFILEVRNVLSIYNIQEADKMAMVENWLGRKGLHYLETLMANKKKHATCYKGCLICSLPNLNLNTMR